MQSYTRGLTTVLVDSSAVLGACLEDLERLMERSDAVAAVDCEGVDLDRNGRLCTVQILCRGGDRTYVVDIVLLGKSAFATCTASGFCLKGLIERPDKVKLFFDPRYDSDALWHQFEVFPRGVFCLQMADVAYRRQQGLGVKYVSGLKKVIEKYVEMSAEDETRMREVKSRGKAMFLEETGGSYDVWVQRPLDEELVEYAACDVRYMIDAYDVFKATLSQQWQTRVHTASAVRVGNCLGSCALGSDEHPSIAPVL